MSESARRSSALSSSPSWGQIARAHARADLELRLPIENGKANA